MGVLVVAVGAVIVYGAVQLGHIPRVACPSCQEPEAGRPMHVLVVGSDTRAAVTNEPDEFGTPQMVTGQRSDTIMVVRVDPDEERAAVLSVPRDLWVPIASGGVNRINTAFENGPDNLVRTVSAALGIPIHHYVEIDFAGFRDIVGAVDGVSVFFPTPARDLVTGLEVDRAGCVELDGGTALAYVRSRNYETLVQGRWQGGGAGDLDRINRQQDFIRRVLGKVRAVRNPLTAHRLVTTGTKRLRFDEGLSTSELEALALRFRSLDPADLQMQTVPAVFDHVVINRRRASILRLQQPQAGEVVARFVAGEEPAAPTAATPAVPTTTARARPGLVTTTTAPARSC